MKKYIILAIGCLISCASMVDAAYDKADLEEALESAIEASDSLGAKKALKRLSPLTVKNQKRFLALAEEILETREQNATLLKSGRDLTNVAAGIALTAMSAYALTRCFNSTRTRSQRGHVIRESVESESNWLYALPWAAGVVGGLYYTQHGAFCTKAKARLKAAKQIVDALKDVEKV